MKAQTFWKSRRTRHVVILEAFDAHTVVYRFKKGNELTPLHIVSVNDFLLEFDQIDALTHKGGKNGSDSDE